MTLFFLLGVSLTAQARASDPQIFYQVDPEGALGINAVLSSPEKWQPLPGSSGQASFGYTSDTYWLTFSLKNDSDYRVSRFIEIAYPVLDYVDVYFYRQGKPVGQFLLGDKRPFDERPINHRFFIVPAELPPSSTTDVFLRIESTSSIQVPVTVWQTEPILEYVQQENLLLGLYFGAIIVLALYNLFVYLSVQEEKYLYYVLYMLGTAFFLASLNGLSFQFLWPEATQWNDRSIPFSLSLLIFFAALFIRDFLDVTPARKKLHGLFQFVISMTLIEAVMSLFVAYETMILIVILSAVFAMGAAVFVGVLRLSEGYKPARFYCIAWAAFLLGGFVLALNKFTILPRNLFTETALQLGSVLEGVLLSFALADRLNEEKAQRFLAQQEVLEKEKTARLAQERALQHEREARAAEAHALQVQRKANEELEAKVSERTRALEQANKELEVLTFSDALTGVRNRRYFDEMIKEALGRCARSRTAMALLLVDLDHFKRLNDTHGHLMGDECLKLSASVMKSQVNRSSDIVARYGGEEFAVLLPETDLDGALHIADRVRRGIEKTIFGEADNPISLTASIGVHCAIPDRDTRPSGFIEEADKALYRAKETGRNRVCSSADRV